MSPLKRRLIITLATLLLVAMAPAVVLAAGGQFTDDDDSIFEAHIEWLADAGVTAGCNPPANDNFCPNDNVNRGQMAAFMRRFAQYIGAEDGIVNEADNAATADLADNSRALNGHGYIEFQPSENDFEVGDDFAVTANGQHTLASATVRTNDGSSYLCLVGTVPRADIRVSASGYITGFVGTDATFYLDAGSGSIPGTVRKLSGSNQTFATEVLFETVGGTDTFELIASEGFNDTYTVRSATIIAEVISETRCKGNAVITLDHPSSDDPDLNF